MSHWMIARIKIRNPNLQLLRQVLHDLVKELGGEIVQSITDYYGRQRSDFLIGVRTPHIPNGVGVRVDEKGELQLIGDFYGYGGAVREFQRLLQQNYVASATAMALQRLGYQVTQQKAQDKVFIRAVAW